METPKWLPNFLCFRRNKDLSDKATFKGKIVLHSGDVAIWQRSITRTSGIKNPSLRTHIRSRFLHNQRLRQIRFANSHRHWQRYPDHVENAQGAFPSTLLHSHHENPIPQSVASPWLLSVDLVMLQSRWKSICQRTYNSTRRSRVMGPNIGSTMEKKRMWRKETIP